MAAKGSTRAKEKPITTEFDALRRCPNTHWTFIGLWIGFALAVSPCSGCSVRYHWLFVRWQVVSVGARAVGPGASRPRCAGTVPRVVPSLTPTLKSRSLSSLVKWPPDPTSRRTEWPSRLLTDDSRTMGVRAFVQWHGLVSDWLFLLAFCWGGW